MLQLSWFPATLLVLLLVLALSRRQFGEAVGAIGGLLSLWLARGLVISVVLSLIYWTWR